MVTSSTPVENVGISGISVYFPNNFVSQNELEKFDNVSAGKYTVGLGQQEMGFCADNEDVVSISLTVTTSLMDSYNIDPASIGFLAVGSETLIDKSKSVKTELMKLFPDNHDIEGVDVKNACYGGTQAVLHAIDWVYANYGTEKRNAIAVLADIAIYEKGPARCTGGAGAIAVLITPDSPIAFDRGLRASYMTSSWDFYKPVGKKTSEYPVFDGAGSLKSYMTSVEECYKLYRQKAKRISNEDVSLSLFSAVMFHSPFARMTQKALARLVYHDAQAGHGATEVYSSLGTAAIVNFEDRAVSKIVLAAAEKQWQEKTDCNLELNRRIGNMYTSSLFAQLIAFIARSEEPQNDRILMFAYGSGSASTMFSASLRLGHERLDRMRVVCRAAVERLDERQMHSPQRFTEVLEMREQFLTADVPTVPRALSEPDLPLFDGTFWLTSIDDKYRREYQLSLKSNANGTLVNGSSGDPGSYVNGV